MAKKKKAASDTSKENAPVDQPLPDQRMMERAMREIAGHQGGKRRTQDHGFTARRHIQ